MSEFVHDWSPLLAVLISSLVGIASYFIRSESRTLVQKAEANVIAQVNAHHDRLLRLETSMDTLPTRDDFHKLAIANTDMIGEMKAIKVAMQGLHETVAATRASVQRVNDYLLHHKDRDSE